MNKNYTLVFLIFLLASCTTSQKLKDFSSNNLIFGSGGGVTGTTNEYVLHYNGLIEKENSLTQETTQIKTISKKESKKLYQQFLNDGLDSVEYSVPGNMSYFIGFKNDSLSKKITWDGDQEPPVKAKAFYKNLIQLISNQ